MKRIILGAIAFISAHGAFAQFSGQGNGTERDPYLVSNADELFEVRNDLNAYYRQTEDIDLKEWLLENSGNLGWNPIGTSTTPFSGNYNGNNHAILNLSINRETDNVGMWGCVANATIKNVSFINPTVKGGNNVGIVFGYCDMQNSVTVSEVAIISGKVSGVNRVGGIAGSMIVGYTSEPYNQQYTSKVSTCIIQNCYCNTDIYATNECGGICGITNGEYNTALWTHTLKSEVKNNVFEGRINAADKVGGIIGFVSGMPGEHYVSGGTYAGAHSDNGNYCVTEHNVSIGSIYSNNTASGIVGNYVEDIMVYSYGGARPNESYIKYNVACLDTISGVSIYRISNCQFENNIAKSNMVGLTNNRVVTFDETTSNGIGYGPNQLRRKTTYEGLGFDFNTDWNINEGETYPFLKSQINPPFVSKFISGSKGHIEGTCDGNGIVYIINGHTLYQAQSIEGTWELTIGAISENDKVSLCFKKDGFLTSIPSYSYASAPEIVEPDVILGDSNSDGVVDAADVVGTINYILGKPSSSFNQLNADVNEDGQILVDDAVGTVNVIMNAQ